MVGLAQTRSRNLGDATEEYVNGILQANNYLRKQTGYSQTSIDRRNAYAIVLSGRSPVTGNTERVTVYTTQLRNGALLYIAMVSPENESSRYTSAFRNMINSVNINDQ